MFKFLKDTLKKTISKISGIIEKEPIAETKEPIGKLKKTPEEAKKELKEEIEVLKEDIEEVAEEIKELVRKCFLRIYVGVKSTFCKSNF